MNKRVRLTLFMALTLVASAGLWTVLARRSDSTVGAEKGIRINRVRNGFHSDQPDKPVFILALGSDQGSPRYDREGSVTSGRADSIHIIAINPKSKSGTIIGIPRDTYVRTKRYTGRINGAMAEGGPEGMVAAVEQWSGVKFDYSIVTSFEGFEDMVNELGGVVVDVPYDVNDSRYSNAKFDKGQQVLGGYQALSFARNRYDAPQGDFSRSENQGLILLGALRRARAESFKTPGILLKYLKIFFKYVQTNLSTDEALQLGLLATRIQTSDMRNMVIDGYITTADGASVVEATSGAKDLLEDVADDALVSDESVEKGSGGIAGVKAGPKRKQSKEPSPSGSPSADPDHSPSAEPSFSTPPIPDPTPTATPTS